MDNFDYPAIGQRIKMLRKRKGLNQTELAQQLKKSLRTVQKYDCLLYTSFYRKTACNYFVCYKMLVACKVL